MNVGFSTNQSVGGTVPRTSSAASACIQYLTGLSELIAAELSASDYTSEPSMGRHSVFQVTDIQLESRHILGRVFRLSAVE